MPNKRRCQEICVQLLLQYNNVSILQIENVGFILTSSKEVRDGGAPDDARSE